MSTDDASASSDALERFSALISDSDEAVILTHLDGTITGWSRGATELFGHHRDDVIGRHVEILHDAGNRARLDAVFDKIAFRQPTGLIEGTHRRIDGTPVEVEVRASPVGDEQGVVVGAIAIARDVSEHRAREKELRDSQAFLERTQAIGHIGAWRSKTGPDEDLHFTTESYKILGIDEGVRLTNLDFFRLVANEDRNLLVETLVRVRREGGRAEMEVRVIRPDGTARWVLLAAEAEADDEGETVGLSGLVQDITERKEAESRLAHDALHDRLTGLPNRNLFLDRVTRALERSRRNGTSPAVLYLDVDAFKIFNDARGQREGDELLVAIGERLRKTLLSTDTVARLSADEFGLVIEDVKNALSATDAASAILKTVAEPFLVQGEEAFVTASIGIALGRAGTSAESLVRDADLAMYRAKVRGRNRFELYDFELRRQAEDRFATEAALRRALGDGELFLEFQPIASISGDRFVGAEALVRWQHPERGVVAPEQFIPIAEETGLIIAFGTFVLESACRVFRAWRDEAPGLTDWRGSVNVSATQLRSPDFLEVVKGALKSSGLAPETLRIELTESAVVEGEAVTDVLEQIRGLGIEIAIDDFGTKYSALSYLAALPIDELKIDRSFVERLVKDRPNRAIVSSIVAIGHALGLTVTAEGVDTKSQLEVLSTLGCDAAQGFYFAEAMAPEDCLAALTSSPTETEHTA